MKHLIHSLRQLPYIALLWVAFLTLESSQVKAQNTASVDSLIQNVLAKNDKWVIKNIDKYPNNVVSVVDKAGRRIFYQESYKNTWDGTFGGKRLAAGTYYYFVDFGPGYGRFKGYITVKD